MKYISVSSLFDSHQLIDSSSKLEVFFFFDREKCIKLTIIKDHPDGKNRLKHLAAPIYKNRTEAKEMAH